MIGRYFLLAAIGELIIEARMGCGKSMMEPAQPSVAVDIYVVSCLGFAGLPQLRQYNNNA